MTFSVFGAFNTLGAFATFAAFAALDTFDMVAALDTLDAFNLFFFMRPPPYSPKPSVKFTTMSITTNNGMKNISERRMTLPLSMGRSPTSRPV